MWGLCLMCEKLVIGDYRKTYVRERAVPLRGMNKEYKNSGVALGGSRIIHR